MSTLTEADAETLGRATRAADGPRSPFAHPEIHAEVEHAAVGTKTHLLLAFVRGWDAEYHRRLYQELRQLDTTICPDTTEVDGYTHSIVGCGRTIPDERDPEGLVDCPECGIWFNPDEERERII